MLKIREKLEGILTSGSTGDHRRPVIGRGNESNVKGLHIIGDLAGAPVIKLAMAQGVEVIDYLASRPGMEERPAGDALETERGRRLGAGAKSSSPRAAMSVGLGQDLEPQARDPGALDVLIVGAGAAGLNAALRAQEIGLRYALLEKEKIANTIENFPEGKWVYAEPDDAPAKGKLWLDGARKEDLIARWNQIVADNSLDVRVEEPLTALEEQSDGTFVATTPGGTYRTRKVVLATGQRGNPRKLGVPGEEREEVYHSLYSARKYHGEQILVVGGGNSAVEAALTLAERNKVVLSYRGGEFARLFKDNRRQLDEAIAGGRIEAVLHSQVERFEAGRAVLEVDAGGHQEPREVDCGHAFVLIGADLPVKFLKSLGIELENEWDGTPLWSALLTAATFAGLWLFAASRGGAVPFDRDLGSSGALLGALAALLGVAGLIAKGVKGDRWSWLGLSFFVWYSIYGIKVGAGEEFWPYKNWGYASMSFFERPWAFWYTVLYTALMTIFGLRALKRWGLDRRDRFQIWRFTSLLAFQWIFFFLLPEFLFQWAVEYQWVGEKLASDPQFADQAWRTYGIAYAWPLFFYTWLYDPHKIWIIWGVVLTFGVIPLFVLFNGKRYCSWICGCGGLAETFGDQWRHLAPKGKTSIKLEAMGTVVLLFAAALTVVMLVKDTYGLYKTADWGIYGYRLLVDVWLVGILPVTVYPFMGGKVWCRFWCPLAKMMQFTSKIYTRLGISRFHIVANDKCIACNECSRNCQVGIDVMQYALKQETLNNATSSCIGCGVCVTVCPMDTLSYSTDGKRELPVVSGEGPQALVRRSPPTGYSTV